MKTNKKKLLMFILLGIFSYSCFLNYTVVDNEDAWASFRRTRIPISPEVIQNAEVFGYTLNWLMTPDSGEENHIVTPDIRDILLNEPELTAVIAGASSIAVLDSQSVKDNLKDIQYNLWALGISQGIHINAMQFQDGRVCVYNEDSLRSLLYQDGATEQMRLMGATKTGLELLIKQDILRDKGIFHDVLGQQKLPETAKQEITRTISDVFKGNITLNSTNDKDINVSTIVMCTFGRPEGLRRSLSVQTKDMEIYGHKDTVKFLIIDDTPVDSSDQRKIIGIINEFRNQGFNIEYLGRDKHISITKKISQILFEKYSKKGADPRILAEISNPVTGEIDADKLFKMVEVILAAKNIAAARTFSTLYTNGRMMNIDDDALPKAAVVSREDLDKIMAERQVAVDAQKNALYKELSRLQGVPEIKDESDFEMFLSTARAQDADVQKVLAKYYAYSPDGSTGLIPQAASEITTNEEHRLRFNRMYDERYAEEGATHFVAVEDAIVRDMEKGRYKIPQDNYSFLYLDYVRIFNRALDEPVGSPAVGKVLTLDHRGINGVVDDKSMSEMGRKVVLATSHFNNARDLSAEALMTEAIRLWVKEWDVGNQEVIFNPKHRPDIADMQQVVGQAVHISTYGSVSTDFDKTNQYCFNTTSMDTPYPLPTTGGWLRIEEPFYKQLVEFITGGTQAWTAAFGGHRRIPAERRPRVDKQMLWEEMAMILYPTLDRIFADISGIPVKDLASQGLPPKDLVDSPDSVFEERIRTLGNAYLQESKTFTLTQDDKNILLGTRERAAFIANELWKVAESWEPGIVRKEIKELATRLAEQFNLTVYTMTVDSEGNKVDAYRREGYGPFDWETGKEKFQWPSEPSWHGGFNFSDLQNGLTKGKITIPGGDTISLNPDILTDMTIEAFKQMKPGESVVFFWPTDRLKYDFLENRVTKYIRQQLEYDGVMLLFWPDIVDAMKTMGYIER